MQLSLVPTALQIPWCQKAKVLPADALNAKTIAQGGFTNSQGAPTKVFAVIVSSNDTVAHDVQLGVLDSVNGFFPLGTVTVPINSGYVGSVQSINLLSAISALPLDETGCQYFFMGPTDILQVRCMIAAVSAGKEIDVVVQGADF